MFKFLKWGDWAPKQLERADLCLAEPRAQMSELSPPSLSSERFNKSDWASAPGRLGKLWSGGETSLGPFLGLEEDQKQKRDFNDELDLQTWDLGLIRSRK